MAKPARLPSQQRRTLARLIATPLPVDLYLAGGAAVGHHVGHRTSLDLDLFTVEPNADLSELRRALLRALPDAEVTAETDAALRLRTSGGPVDVVRYPYPLLDPLLPGPEGCPVAGLRDLAVMKLAAITKRGLRRDFWDLHAILSARGAPLGSVLDDYIAKYGVAEADLYHVLRALTYFDDAERDASLPVGLTESHWNDIKRFFQCEAPKALASRVRP